MRNGVWWPGDSRGSPQRRRPAHLVVPISAAFLVGCFGAADMYEDDIDVFIARYNADGTLAWAKRAGGKGEALGQGIAALPDGSAFVTGVFESSATFGSGGPSETTFTSAGEYDIFIARYDPAGTLVWAKRAGGGLADYGSGIAVLPDGSALVTGGSEGGATFGPGEPNRTALTSAGDDDALIARYNADGTLTWARRAGGSDHDVAFGIAVLPDGSAFLTGQFHGNAQFGPDEPNRTALTSAGDSDLFVARYKADGTLAWARRAGGSDDETGLDVAVLPDGSAFVTGQFESSPTFGPGEPNETTLTSAGESDIFIARYDATGTLVWARRAGGSDHDTGSGITALADGPVFLTGCFGGTATFGPGEPNETMLTSAGNFDIFIARYDADGGFAWAKRVGGDGGDAGSGVAVLPDGSVLVAGNFEGGATFGTGDPNETKLESAGDDDIFIARYNADGTLAWAERAGGKEHDDAEGVTVLPDGSALVTGNFESRAIFGRGEPNQTELRSTGR